MNQAKENGWPPFDDHPDGFCCSSRLAFDQRDVHVLQHAEDLLAVRGLFEQLRVQRREELSTLRLNHLDVLFRRTDRNTRRTDARVQLIDAGSEFLHLAVGGQLQRVLEHHVVVVVVVVLGLRIEFFSDAEDAEFHVGDLDVRIELLDELVVEIGPRMDVDLVSRLDEGRDRGDEGFHLPVFLRRELLLLGFGNQRFVEDVTLIAELTGLGCKLRDVGAERSDE